jgi:hypothetical protein
MGDVDFYVPPSYTEKAREIFLRDGFVLDEGDHAFHLGMAKGAMHFEMHFAPIGSPEWGMTEILEEYWSDICDRAVFAQDVFSEYFLPSDFHHGFIMLTHLRLHMVSSGIGLRHVCDWAAFVNSLSNEEFKNIFEERLKRVGLWKFAKAVSLVAVLLFGMPHKPWMGEDYEIAGALAEDICTGGNFGTREKNRSFEGVFIPNDRKTGKPQNVIFRAFHMANKVVRGHWKAAKKCPLLYPVGWVYFSIRFLFNRLTGRHDVRLIEAYRKSEKRIELYESLRLFMPEK